MTKQRGKPDKVEGDSLENSFHSLLYFLPWSLFTKISEIGEQVKIHRSGYVSAHIGL